MFAAVNKKRIALFKFWKRLISVSPRGFKFLGEQDRVEAEKSRLREQVERLIQTGAAEEAQDYAHLLLKCGDCNLLPEGERLHAAIRERWGQRPERLLLNCLVEMYGKCGSLDKAWLVFSSIRSCNVYSWTIVIAAFAANGDYTGALSLFRKMDLDGIKANVVTYVNVISACSGLMQRRECRRIHSRIAEQGFDKDLVLATALVTMYGKCGDLDSAVKVFEKIAAKNDVVSWNALLAAYSQKGRYEECVELYEKMPMGANEVTYVCVVDGLAGLADLERSRRVHARIREDGLENDCLKSALVDAYGKCGSPLESKQVFDSMMYREISTWNALIAAFAQQRDNATCLSILREMDLEGVKTSELTFVSLLGGFSTTASLRAGRQLHERIVAMGFYSDVMLGSALVTMYGRCGDAQRARSVFDEMAERNAVVFNSMIGAYAELGHPRQAVEVVWMMDQVGLNPDAVTLLSVLFCCSHAGMLDAGLANFRSMREDRGMEVKLDHYRCLVDLFARSGWLAEAEELIEIKFSGCDDLMSRLSLLSACIIQEDGERGSRSATLLASVTDWKNGATEKKTIK